MDYTDLDLDVVSAAKKMNIKNEALVYFRMQDNKVMVTYCGEDTNLINMITSCLENHPCLYDILSTSISLYEESLIPQQ